jgi:hypothetical protein
MNASRSYAGSLNCAVDDGSGAAVVFVYSQGASNLTVIYDKSCVSLYTKAGSYFANADVDASITALTGG